MRLFFAGTEGNSFALILQECGVKNILQSAFFLDYKKPCNELNFPNFLLDSGGFNAITHHEVINIKEYIDYINKYNVKLAISLDDNDFVKSLENLDLLKKYTNAKIIPVYHDSEFINEKDRWHLEKFCEEYNYIAVAGLTRKRLKENERRKMANYVFSITKNKIKIHGLAVTGQKWLKDYPFYSVDSTTWLNGGKYGGVILYKNGELLRPKSLKIISRRKNKEVKSPLVLLSYEERMRHCIKALLQFEDYVTNLWKARGVVWND